MPNDRSCHDLQWSLSSRHSPFARRFILILKIPMKGTKMMHSSIQIRPHLKFSLGRRARNSVRSAGCAVLPSAITAISHTRHFLSFSSPFPDLFCFLHRLHSPISKKSSTTRTNNIVRTRKQTQKSTARQRKVNFPTGRNRAKRNRSNTLHSSCRSRGSP